MSYIPPPSSPLYPPLPPQGAQAVAPVTYKQLYDVTYRIIGDVRCETATKETLDLAVAQLSNVQQVAEASVNLHRQGAPGYESLNEGLYCQLFDMCAGLIQEAKQSKAALTLNDVVNDAVDDLFAPFNLKEPTPNEQSGLLGQHITSILPSSQNSTTTTTTTTKSAAPSASGRMTLNALTDLINRNGFSPDSDSSDASVSGNSDTETSTTSSSDSDSETSTTSSSDSDSETASTQAPSTGWFSQIATVATQVLNHIKPRPVSNLEQAVDTQMKVIEGVAAASKGNGKLSTRQTNLILDARESLVVLQGNIEDKRSVDTGADLDYSSELRYLQEICNELLKGCEMLLTRQLPASSGWEQINNIQSSLYAGGLNSTPSKLFDLPRQSLTSKRPTVKGASRLVAATTNQQQTQAAPVFYTPRSATSAAVVQQPTTSASVVSSQQSSVPQQQTQAVPVFYTPRSSATSAAGVQQQAQAAPVFYTPRKV